MSDVSDTDHLVERFAPGLDYSERQELLGAASAMIHFSARLADQWGLVDPEQVKNSRDYCLYAARRLKGDVDENLGLAIKLAHELMTMAYGKVMDKEYAG